MPLGSLLAWIAVLVIFGVLFSVWQLLKAAEEYD